MQQGTIKSLCPRRCTQAPHIASTPANELYLSAPLARIGLSAIAAGYATPFWMTFRQILAAWLKGGIHTPGQLV